MAYVKKVTLKFKSEKSTLEIVKHLDAFIETLQDAGIIEDDDSSDIYNMIDYTIK